MRTLLLGGLAAAALLTAPALAGAALNPDTDPSRIDWSQLDAKLGKLPTVPAGLKIGAVAKTMTNEYWRLLGEGYGNAAKAAGVTVAVQAAQNEGDQIGQLSIAETMLSQHYDVLLLSPQSNANLQPAVDEAAAAKVPVVDVDDAVIPDAKYYVGAVQRDNGVHAAEWFIKKHPQGGKVAIIEGQAGVFAATQRTAGFHDTITAGGKFTVVASVPGNWDRQLSYDAASTILQQHPDLVGFYCNNDTMALGVVEAVKAAGALGHVSVIGTDGISDAYTSIAAGELTGTVDSFPELTGEIALQVALRLHAGQELPRVIATPQALVTKANMARYKGPGVDTNAALIADAKSAP